MACSTEERLRKVFRDEKYEIFNPDKTINIDNFNAVNNGMRRHAINKYDYPESGEVFFKLESYEVHIPSRGSRIRPGDFTRNKFKIVPIKKNIDLLTTLIEDYEENDNILESKNFKENEINYTLKAIDILQSDKAKQVFEKGKKNNWDLNKILTELQVPKEQKQIILDKDITDREEIITSLLADNSFVVEINTAKVSSYDETDIDMFDPESRKEVTKEEPSQYYSNLTVPGGTNYTENEIATPLITPNIKGHAQFSTDNGIGWFRVDEKLSGGDVTRELQKSGEIKIKTRRILEVQSDLFQKGRDSRDLVNSKIPTGELETIDFDDDGRPLPSPIMKDNENYLKSNQFLQLLNKKNNWVTFFVKSIIQDSAKKGYEKVLFPLGDTAAKIEGHQTLEEFKREKEGRIKSLQASLDKPYFKRSEGYMRKTIDGNSGNYIEIKIQESPFEINITGKNREEAENKYDEKVKELKEQEKSFTERTNKEIKQLKKELADVESGKTQLSSIAKFYQNTVTNVLKKQGFKPVEITDEYGNKWNEVDIKEVGALVDNILLTKKLRNLEDASITEEYLKTKEVKREQFEEEPFSNNVDFILFNNSDKTSFDSVDVLNNIKNNTTDFSAASRELINKLLPILTRTNSKVKLVSKRVMVADDTLMQYDASKNEIQINKESLDGITDERIVQGFLHEVVHSVTIEALKNPKNIDEQMFKSFIRDIFLKYKDKSRLNEEGNLTEQTYGFTNEYEFVAELMSNPQFQEEFKKMENRSLWNRFIDYIRGLFGFKKNSDYHNLIDNITTIIESSNYEGGIEGIYEKKKTEEDTEGYYDLSTIAKKQEKLIGDIQNNLEKNLGFYNKVIKTSKDPDKIKPYRDRLETVLNQVNELSDANKWDAITKYMIYMKDNISSLKSRFYKEDFSDVEILDTISTYKKFLTANDMVGEIQEFINDALTSTRTGNNEGIEIDDLLTLDNQISNIREESISLSGKFDSFFKEELKKILNDRKFATRIIKQWRDKLEKEYKETTTTEPKESWINRQLNVVRKDEVDKDVEEYINDLIESPHFDIAQATAMMNSSININSKLVQILQIMFNETRENIIERNRELDFEMNDVFSKFTKAKGNKKPSELYKNMIEYTKDGMPILKGEYTIKFKEKYDELKEEYDKIKENAIINFGEGTAEYKTAISNSKFAKWVKANTISYKREDGKWKRKPIDKWRTNLSSLSEIEQETLKFFKEKLNEADKQKFGIKSLNTYLLGAQYTALPSVTKSDMERTLEGEVVGIIKDKIKDKDIRVDDVGYELKRTDSKGNIVNSIKVHYRGKIDPKEQSLDLFTLVRLEAQNGINFSEKHKAEKQANLLLDVAGQSKFYKTTQLNRKAIVDRFLNRNKKQLIKGKDSQTYKKLSNMIETNIYDIMHKSAGNWGSVDINKAINFANGWTYMLGMALNEVSAATNVLNGKAQFFLETLTKGKYISSKSLAKAEKIYFNNIVSSMKDINNPVKTAYVNQIIEMFDTMGSMSVGAKQAFIQNTTMKANLNTNTLMFMQNTGEHWLEGVITMAILENIQVMNKDGKFIDRNGNVVKDKKKAASALDMLKRDKKGKLIMDKNVVYTTHTVGVPYNKGGKEMLTSLVQKKASDTLGQYNPNLQPEFMRHWYGKLFGMYRKYLVPMGVARFRGFTHFHKKIDELEDHQLHFSEGLQDYETGMYTEFIRYMFTTVKDVIKKGSLKAVTENWKNMTDTQKGQFRKAVGEFAITALLIPAVMVILEGIKGGDDDDNDWIMFLMLETRRLESELSSYRDIGEQWRIIKSPIPSLRLFDTMGRIGSILYSGEWDAVYEGGKNRGENKLLRNVESILPIYEEFFVNKTYKEQLQFFENMAK